tara:strand:- start:927 stop:1646 length:720 start_codon:yes stop_codon:yes gene_type:complete
LTIQTQQIQYEDNGVILEGHVAWNDVSDKPKPGILVSHAWAGRTDFENEKAQKLAKQGYVGFALDLYGRGIVGSDPTENAALMQPFLDDRRLLQKRMLLAVDQLKKLDQTNQDRIAAIGFCFGGLAVLDLARTGASVSGVVSFHGLLGSPNNTYDNKITAKILLQHGWLDPLATPEQVLEFAKEMSKMDADWQLNAYGGAMHAFTNPKANDPSNGMKYDKVVEKRSWESMSSFLDEIFS